ncbi:MAG: putative MFS-type transporter [Alphaproteobacteria bacterium]|nr:putative MFS-type transporter [Alphaproteobacteria bacterium]
MQRPWAAIAAATLLNAPFGSLYAFSIFLRPLEQALGVTRSDLSIIFGVATAVFSLAMLLAPRLFNLLSAPVLVTLCTLSGVSGIVLAAFADSLVMLGIGYSLLFVLGAGVAYIGMQQGVNFMLKGNHGLVNGYIVSLYPAGAMLLLPIFGWSLHTFGLRATLQGLAAGMLVTGALALAFCLVANMRLVQPQTLTAVAGKRPPRRVFWQMSVVFFLAASAGLMVLSQQVGIIVAYGGTTDLAVLASTAILACAAGGRLGGGWLLDKFSVPAVMAFAHVWSLIGALGLTMFPAPWMAATGLGMIAMGYGFVSGALAGGIAYYWPSADYGRVAGRL